MEWDGNHGKNKILVCRGKGGRNDFKKCLFVRGNDGNEIILIGRKIRKN